MPKPIIDHKKCNLCKGESMIGCVDVCPVAIFEKGNNKINVKKPEECIACRACEVQCPKQAIKVED